MKGKVKTSKIILKKKNQNQNASKNLKKSGEANCESPGQGEADVCCCSISACLIEIEINIITMKLNPIKSDYIGDIYKLKKGEWFLDHQNQTFFSHCLGCL